MVSMLWFNCRVWVQQGAQWSEGWKNILWISSHGVHDGLKVLNYQIWKINDPKSVSKFLFSRKQEKAEITEGGYVILKSCLLIFTGRITPKSLSAFCHCIHHISIYLFFYRYIWQFLVYLHWVYWWLPSCGSWSCIQSIPVELEPPVRLLLTLPLEMQSETEKTFLPRIFYNKPVDWLWFGYLSKTQQNLNYFKCWICLKLRNNLCSSEMKSPYSDSIFVIKLNHYIFLLLYLLLSFPIGTFHWHLTCCYSLLYWYVFFQ